MQSISVAYCARMVKKLSLTVNACYERAFERVRNGNTPASLATIAVGEVMGEGDLSSLEYGTLESRQAPEETGRVWLLVPRTSND